MLSLTSPVALVTMGAILAAGLVVSLIEKSREWLEDYLPEWVLKLGTFLLGAGLFYALSKLPAYQR